MIKILGVICLCLFISFSSTAQSEIKKEAKEFGQNVKKVAKKAEKGTKKVIKKTGKAIKQKTKKVKKAVKRKGDGSPD
jgi:TRAP-type C4-dicarboxylate transport system substrate-binding protein